MAHVTFIHGIANKPPQDQLLDIWLRSLADGGGLDLGTEGVTSSMVYWADVVYKEPAAEAETENAGNDAVAVEREEAPEVNVDVANADELAWTASLAAKLAVPLVTDTAAEAVAPVAEIAPSPVKETLERIPLPWFIKERLMKVLLRDVHHYLFNVKYDPGRGTTYQVQDEIRGRMIRALQEGASKPGPHVVVSHSMGTVLAYDCLKRVPDAPRVDGLMTAGSPLGLDEIQDKLKPGWSRDDGFPTDKLSGGWVNVYDKLDPVAGLDPNLANDYRQGKKNVIDDLNEQSYGSWRHDITKYLRGDNLRTKLRGLLKL
ncbi:MAG TPA: hypothetical protein VGK45_18160 [Thermoanaerobaculia bacterium]